MKNLLISDFDGTLYHNNINIYKENLLFIKRWASSPDNYFSIATGRLAREIYNICTKENILYEFIVCNEGSSIIYNKFDKNDIFTFTASSCLQIYRSLIKLVESKQLKYFLETDGEYGFIDCYNLDDKCRNIVREKKKTKYNYLTFKDKNSDIKTSIFNIITYVIPFATTSYYPTTFLLFGENNNIIGLIIGETIFFFSVFVLIWRRGIGTYSSTGT